MDFFTQVSNLILQSTDRDFVKKFADEFIRLYGEGHPVQQ